MQKVSKAYKEAMKKPFRNRGYIKAYIGVINSDAQKYAGVELSRNKLTYFSNINNPFDGYTVDREYATSEQDFSRVDGSMFFLPKKETGMTYYNNGLVTDALIGSIYITFGGKIGFDIKGLTVDFGNCYPTKFDIEWDNGLKSYINEKELFITEDVFDGVSFIKITAHEMVNGQGRLRIHEISMGIVNSFTNKNVINYSYKEYVSPIAETIPSEDMTLTVDNHDLYYSPDNPESTLAFFEQGQQVKVSFGYDVDGNGNIEWLNPNICYLKSWSATDTQAKFTAVDRLDYIDSTYLRGMYREQGISLYDLAIDVFDDMGITDTRERYVDEYLKDVIVFNPIPKIKHSQALQLIANAGRCKLYIDRNNRICLQSSFVPRFTFSANEGVFEEDGSYVSDSTFIVTDITEVSSLPMILGRNNFGLNKHTAFDEYWDKERIPTITVDLEASFSAFGLMINFKEIPKEFTVKTFYQDMPVNEYTYTNIYDEEFVSDDEFERFDKMQIIFTKGPANSKLYIDKIQLANFTDYTLSRSNSLTNSPTATRKDKIKGISVVETQYSLSAEEEKSLKSETLVLPQGNTELKIELSNASYGLRAEIEDNPNIQIEIIESSNFFVRFRIKNVPDNETSVKYNILGYEYQVSELPYTVTHNQNGQEISWKNPLISNNQLAKNLEAWLAVDYLGDVEYSLPWRGDPRVDGNDLFNLEIKDRGNVLIHAYQNELKYNGAWSATMKARKAVLEWQ